MRKNCRISHLTSGSPRISFRSRAFATFSNRLSILVQREETISNYSLEQIPLLLVIASHTPDTGHPSEAGSTPAPRSYTSRTKTLESSFSTPRRSYSCTPAQPSQPASGSQHPVTCSDHSLPTHSIPLWSFLPRLASETG